MFRGKVTGSFFKREMLSPEFLPISKAFPLSRSIRPRRGSLPASSPLPCKTPCSCFLKPCATLSLDALRSQYRLCHLGFALEHIHFPKSEAELDVARYRLIFEEFLVLQLGLMRIKRGRKEKTCIRCQNRFPGGIRKLLPFSLTNAQRRAISEAISDMAGDSPMNRLIQGRRGQRQNCCCGRLCWVWSPPACRPP